MEQTEVGSGAPTGQDLRLTSGRAPRLGSGGATADGLTAEGERAAAGCTRTAGLIPPLRGDEPESLVLPFAKRRTVVPMYSAAVEKAYFEFA